MTEFHEKLYASFKMMIAVLFYVALCCLVRSYWLGGTWCLHF